MNIETIIHNEIKRVIKDPGLKDVAIKLLRATDSKERKEIIDEFAGIGDGDEK
jgi:hypothetical protein